KGSRLGLRQDIRPAKNVDEAFVGRAITRAANAVCFLPPCGGGVGRGSLSLREACPPTPTPTPNPSPQGGGECTKRAPRSCFIQRINEIERLVTKTPPPSPGLAQDDAHGVEQVDGHADPAGGGDALAGEPEHPPQLKDDERSRNDLPGMVEMLERKPEAGGQAAHARPRKEPQMLR